MIWVFYLFDFDLTCVIISDSGLVLCWICASIAEVFKRIQLLAMAATFRAFFNSPVGPKTTHFWGPVANWGFVAAVCATNFFFICCVAA